MKQFAVLLFATWLTGCTTAVDLAYVPISASMAQATPVIGAVNVTDARDETDPHYIGAIRGGFGNPLKTLTTSKPVKDDVAAVFEAALRARGLYGEGGPATLSVVVQQLSANWVARREGHTTFTLALQDKAGRTLFSDKEDVLKIEGSVVTFNAGVFASLDDLQKITTLSLSTAVDQALDKPSFRAAVTSIAGGQPTS